MEKINKKILYISNARIPTEKAHGLQIVKTIEALINEGADVELLLPRRENRIGESTEDYYNLEVKLKVFYTKDIFFFLKNTPGNLYFTFQRFFFVISALFYGLRSKADSIYSREITVCFLLSLFGKNVIFEDHEPKESREWLYRFFLKRIRKKIIVPCNLVELYRKFGISPESYVVAPNGIDIKEFEKVEEDKTIWEDEFNISREHKVVLYVGYFFEWKGIYTLLDSAKWVNEKTKVVLIGGVKEYQEKAEEYVRQNGINNVFLRYFIPHKEVIKYIKSADILVLPNTAKEERSTKYTTPIKLFEYMASGASIIASDIPSFASYLRNNENALLFEPDNSKDLSDKINYLIENEKLSNKFIQNTKEQVKNFTWEKRAKKILEFVRN
ncbi:MAG: glycosyltransferase family 4 protein [Patescibacteria group bacterium]